MLLNWKLKKPIGDYLYHPKRNSDSEESQRNFEEIQKAYKILSAEWPVKQYFGFSEEEIEKFKSEEMEELKKTFSDLDDYSYSSNNISYSIDKIEQIINFFANKMETSEMFFFLHPRK